MARRSPRTVIKRGKIDEMLPDRKYCRLCGHQQDDVKSDPGLLRSLDSVFGGQLGVYESNHLPTTVCVPCSKNATIVEQFWERTFKAQLVLRTIFSKNTDDPTLPAEGDTTIGSEEESNRPDSPDTVIANGNPETECVYLESGTPASTPDTAVDESEVGDESYFVDSENVKSHLDAELDGKEFEKDALSTVDVEPVETARITSKAPAKKRKSTVANGRKKENPSYRVCHHCGKTFETNVKLKNHLQSHSDERPFACDVCGKQFKLRRDLTMHVESAHEGKIFKCTLCEVEFRWRKGLQRHMLRHKGTAFKHQCQTCGKKFISPGKLREHQMKHTGDRLRCEICGAGYRFNYMLTQHKMRKHNMTFPGVKLYEKKVSKRKNTKRKECPTADTAESDDDTINLEIVTDVDDTQRDHQSGVVVEYNVEIIEEPEV
ncbi:transcription factor Ouib-like [Anopheles aquasalis]|uniref:transcription factor Ouib-like n=1 Tax=Anopheles aquasalis TaxID=42839 RepID=UPI00215A24CE|nr:transcription factor Ouib-like [Anopheles aquasalis]